MEITLTILLGVAGTLALLARAPRKSLSVAASLGVLVMLAGGFALYQPSVDLELESQTPYVSTLDGYRSSDECAACHPGEYETWHRTYHRTMTQRASEQTIFADFKDVTLESWNRQYKLDRIDDRFYVDMVDPDWDFDTYHGIRRPQPSAEPPHVQARVVMVTGSHHMQTYWVPSRNGRALRSLPFVWMNDEKRWLPRESVFIRHQRYGRMVPEWNSNCLKCHSTRPRPGFDLKTGTINTAVAELGIACEACHGPAAEHIVRYANPVHRYRRHADDTLSDPTIVNPKRLSPQRSSQVCGQCHGIYRPLDAVQFATDGFAYKPGDDAHATREYLRHPHSVRRTGRSVQGPVDESLMKKYFWPDGVVRVTGREYTAMSESGCYLRGDLSCLSCHSMHQSDPDDQLARDMDSDEACLQCHQDYRDRVAEHTHHETASTGSRCYNCHMPHTAYGLLKGVRNHLIDSPAIPDIIEKGRPNACNLCHLDQTLQWTTKHLADWYGQERPLARSNEEQSIAAGVLWVLRGDAGLRALAAWHMSWPPAQETAGSEWTIPLLARLLNDPYDAVRYIAARTIEELQEWGGVSYDFLMNEPDRIAALRQVILEWANRPEPIDADPRPELLLSADGESMGERIDTLYQQRDDSLDYLSE